MNSDVLKSFFPENRNKLLSDDERATFFLLEHQFETENNSTIIKRNGKELRDPKTLNPIPVKEAVESYFKEREWLSPVEETPKSENVMSAFVKKWKSSNPGKSEWCEDFDKALAVHLKDNPDFNFYA